MLLVRSWIEVLPKANYIIQISNRNTRSGVVLRTAHAASVLSQVLCWCCIGVASVLSQLLCRCFVSVASVLCQCCVSVTSVLRRCWVRCWVGVESVLSRCWVGVESVLSRCWESNCEPTKVATARLYTRAQPHLSSPCRRSIGWTIFRSALGRGVIVKGLGIFFSFLDRSGGFLTGHGLLTPREPHQ